MSLKAHITVGTKTNIITGVKITGAHSHDTNKFPEIVEQTAENFTINEVSADKAYSSRANMEVVTELGGHAFIPFKSNTSGKQRGFKTLGKMAFSISETEYSKDLPLIIGITFALEMTSIKYSKDIL